jgi:pSer/pThr/pTyr-binding forkhead associated (FHA) protein
VIAKLIGRTGPTAGQDFTINDEARLGASLENDIRILAPGVSRKHARVWRENDHFWIEDVGATNGTFLNGARIQRAEVRHLDVITLGRAVDLIFLHREKLEPSAIPVDHVTDVKIQIMDGAEAGTVIDVPKGELSFGRSDTCNVVLGSRAIGKLHARLQRTSDQVLLQDLQSVNGTFVNGKRIDSIVALANGDVINFAGVRSVTISIDGDAASASDAAIPQAMTMPVFDQEWKTRFMWSPDEMAAVEAARAEAMALANMRAPAVEPAPPARPAVAAKPAAAPKPEAAPKPVAPKPEAVPKPETPAQTVATPQKKPTPVPPAPKPEPPKAAPKIRGARLVSAATTVELGLGTFTIGRGATADVRVDDPQMSRAHATVAVDESAVMIEDRQTVNGTLINGQEVKGRQRLQNGDAILLGATEFKIEVIVG